MPHAVAYHCRARRRDGRRPVAVGQPAETGDRAESVLRQVGAGQHRDDAGRRRRGRGVDRADTGMRMRRAQHKGVSLARTNEIVDVMTAPGQKPLVLDAADRLADAELVHPKGPPTSAISAASKHFAIAQPRGFAPDFGRASPRPHGVGQTELAAWQKSWRCAPRRGRVGKASRANSGGLPHAPIRDPARPPCAGSPGMARPAAGGDDRAGIADRRPAPSHVGPAGQPLSVPGFAGGCRQRPQHRRDLL